MDAGTTNLKKICLFLATALLLAAPLSAQTLNVDTSTVNIGSASCNNFQFVTVSSSGGPISFTANIAYNQGDVHGDWLYVTPTSGTVNSNTTPVTTASVKIGLNRQFTSNDQATVVLRATSPSGVADVRIAVNYFAQNSTCSGGNGTLNNGVVSISPSSLAFSTGQGGAQTLPLNVSNLTAAPVTIYTQVPPADTWLTTNVVGATTLPAFSQTTVSVTATAGTLGTGNLNSSIDFIVQGASTLTLPVSYAIGSGTTGSGTLTVNGSANTSTTFQYIASGSSATGIPAATCLTLVDSNSAATSYSYTYSTSNGSSWLRVNGIDANAQTNQSFAGNCLNIQPNTIIQTLASGAYTATITLTASDSSTAVVTVNLLVSAGSAPGVTVQPGLIYQFPDVPVGTTTSQQQSFTITAAAGITLGTAVASSNPSWFTLTSPANTGSAESFTVYANPTGIPAGIYSTTITFTSSGTSSGQTTIVITMSVGQGTSGTCTTNCGGPTVNSTVVPSSLAFATQVGSLWYTSGGGAQNLTITGAAGSTWSATINYGSGPQGWLTFGQGISSGTFDATGPVNLRVDIQPSALPATTNPYTAQVIITTPSGTITIPVSLLVSSNPVLLTSPSSILFSSDNGSVPTPVTVSIGASDLTYPPIPGNTPAVTASTSTTWLSVSVNGNRITVTPNPAGLATGTYAGSVLITNASYPNSPLAYPVVIVINGGASTTGSLTLTASSLNFSAIAAGSPPAAQTLGISTSGNVAVTVSTSLGTCASYSWLSVSPSGTIAVTSTQYNLSVSVNQNGIPAGTTCSGTVNLATNAGTQTVNVSMSVNNFSTNNNVTVAPSNGLTFSYVTGQSNPASQTLHITNTASGTAATPLTITVSQNNGPSGWLMAAGTTGATSATTPYDLPVSVNTSNLTAGTTYTGIITVTPTGGTAVPVNVTLTVTSQATVVVTPTSDINFSYIVGGSNPSAATLQISAGGSAANFSVTTSSAGWLKVSQTSGTTPTTGSFPLTVTADPTGLSAGQTYNGFLTIAGTGGALGSTIINVNLTVTAPLPTINKVTNAASFLTGPIAPGEIISLFADNSHPIGPTPAVGLTADKIVNNQLPTTMGGVQVVFLPSGQLAPLIYVSATQINLVVPYEVQGQGWSLQVKYLGQTSNAPSLSIAGAAPGIFYSPDPTSLIGPASYLAYDTPANGGGYLGVNVAVPRGGTITFYVTGEGLTNNNVTGRVTPGTTPFTLPLQPPSVLIGGQPANVSFYAEAPGYLAGLLQVNVVVPTNIGTGPVSLQVSFGTSGQYSSQSGVQITTR